MFNELTPTDMILQIPTLSQHSYITSILMSSSPLFSGLQSRNFPQRSPQQNFVYIFHSSYRNFTHLITLTIVRQ